MPLEIKNLMPTLLQIMIVVLLVGIFLIFDFPTAVAEEVLISEPALKTYILHLKKPEDESHGRAELYDNFMPANRRIYSYQHVMRGFAVKLTAEEAEALKHMEGVLSVQPERRYFLHTTQSPKFLGLNQNSGFWNQSSYGKGVIIGVIDTGITPGHPSFSDEGMSPPPFNEDFRSC